MGFSTTAKNAALDGLWSAVASGSKVQLRSGAAPSDASATGALLGETTIGGGSAPAAAGSITVLYGESITITVAGTIGHVRITEADGSTGIVCWSPSELVGQVVDVAQNVLSNTLSMPFPAPA